MKSLTINTLAVALAMALWGTPAMATSREMPSLPVSPAEQTDTHSVATATSSVPLHALNRFDAQTLAAQEMTDQELKAVEGGATTWLLDIPGAGLYFLTVDGNLTILKGPLTFW
jgi:bacteriocin-like protein